MEINSQFVSWAQRNPNLLRDSNYVWVFLLFFLFWFFLAHFSLALECEVGSSPRRKELLRQRDLRSDRFFILSLTHEFLSPNSYDDLYDPEGTPRTLSPAHVLLPQMLLDPVLSQLVIGFWFVSNGARGVMWWMCLRGLSWVRRKLMFWWCCFINSSQCLLWLSVFLKSLLVKWEMWHPG